MAFAGEADDAGIAIGELVCGLKGWKEEFGQKEVAEVVGAELNFEGFYCLAHGYSHDASVQHEDVQALRLGLKFLDGSFDGGEGSEVERKVGYSGGWVELLNF